MQHGKITVFPRIVSSLLYSFPPSIVSAATIQLKNFHIYHFQKRIVSVETIHRNTVYAACTNKTFFKKVKSQKLSMYCISANSFLGNYSIYEVKNCHNSETI